MTDHKKNILGKVDFLGHLSESDLQHLSREGRVVRLAREEQLFDEGEPGTSMYVVEAGILEVVKGGVVLAKRGVGEYVGEMALINSSPRSARVKAVTAAVVLEFDTHLFQSALAPDSGVLIAIMRTLSRRAQENLRVFDSPNQAPSDDQEQNLKYLMQESGLTAREADVAYLICEGLSDKVIARQLKISHYTVKDHLKKIYAKLSINSRTQLVALAHR